MENLAFIEHIVSEGIGAFRTSYDVSEVTVDPEYRELNIGGMIFRTRQYDVSGVGNLTVMTCANNANMQSLSFVVTPYYKNIPMLSLDYILIGPGRMVINETYDLVSEKTADYEEITERFRSVMEKVSLDDLPQNPRWYDSLRSACACKKGTSNDDPVIVELFTRLINAFIGSEKAAPAFGSETERTSKWNCTSEYADRLVSEGGVAADNFKRALGDDVTRKFFRQVFFGCDKYDI